MYIGYIMYDRERYKYIDIIIILSFVFYFLMMLSYPSHIPLIYIYKFVYKLLVFSFFSFVRAYVYGIIFRVDHEGGGKK